LSCNPDLSTEAKRLLVEAMNNPEQTVVTVRCMDGMSVRINGMEFVKCMSPESTKYWESVIEELLDHGFLHARGDNKSIFLKLTPNGCQAAKSIKEHQTSPLRRYDIYNHHRNQR